MFVSRSDFDVLPYHLSVSEEMEETFQAFIDQEEEGALRSLLGHQLYEEFVAGLALLDNGEGEGEENEELEKWELLRDGNSYTFNGKYCRWVGMKELMKPFIYERYLSRNFRTVAKVGGVSIPKTENSIIVAPANEIVSARLTFRKLCGVRRNRIDTLYGFVSNFPNDYQNFVYAEPPSMNTFNL